MATVMRRGDAGAVTVVVAALVAAAVILAGVLALAVNAVADRSNARASADLAALAAAHHQRVVATSWRGPHASAPCEMARDVAQRNGALLTSCRVGTDDSVTVTVQVDAATAVARAGPSSAYTG